MKKLLIFLILLCWIGSILGQEYKWKAELNTPTIPGFYKIDLDPSVISKLNPTFSDIRIKDNKGRDIPYFMDKEQFSVTKRVFKEYKIIEKINWRNGATVLVVKNENKDTINNVQLQIKNFDVRKRLEIAGSDDYENWYTIKENYLFHSADGQQTTSEVKSMNFPYTDYQYYRIIIYDWFSSPINVLKIGYYDTYRELGKFKKLTSKIENRWDSLLTKQTYVKINFSETPYFDKLVIRAEKPYYYYRNAKICSKRKDKKGRVHYDALAYLKLNSNSDLTTYFSDFEHKEIYLVIDNEDNPPLENITVEAFQLNRYLITYLEGSQDYKLIFKNDRIKRTPNYDINYFRNNIGEHIPSLMMKNMLLIPYQGEKKVTTSKIWIWGAIAIVAMFLFYLSYKMISEMQLDKRK